MFHVKHDPSAFVELTEAQRAQLQRYEGLLKTHAIPRGLVAAADANRIHERHVLDSLRAAGSLPKGAITVVDLGSGAGLPGVPLAIARPDASFLLVELRRARAAFLELVVDTVPIPNATVHLGRVEDVRGPVDVCVARAFAPPAATWESASRILRPEGLLLYWAGAGFDPLADLPANVTTEFSSTTALANAGVVAIITSQ
jgi:16S rRNA (guanine527-N7)-methyltransferase